MLFSVSEYNIYCSAVYPICFVPYLVHFVFTVICFETIKNIVHPMLLKKKKKEERKKKNKKQQQQNFQKKYPY